MSGLVRRARSPNNSMASSASESDGTRQLISPATPIGSRLVVSNVNAGHEAKRLLISSALASSRCSQLSSSISICRSRMNRRSTSVVGWPGWSGRPSARATVTGNTSGSVSGARSTYQIPSANSVAITAATCIARRVLPAPPAPVNVTSRFSPSASRMSFISARRPMKLVSCIGRRSAARALAVRSGGKSSRRSVWQSCTTRSGRGRSRNGWVPRSASVTPSGSWSMTSGSVAPESTVWPPWARSRSRAVRLIVGPM